MVRIPIRSYTEEKSLSTQHSIIFLKKNSALKKKEKKYINLKYFVLK